VVPLCWAKLISGGRIYIYIDFEYSLFLFQSVGLFGLALFCLGFGAGITGGVPELRAGGNQGGNWACPFPKILLGPGQGCFFPYFILLGPSFQKSNFAGALGFSKLLPFLLVSLGFGALLGAHNPFGLRFAYHYL